MNIAIVCPNFPPATFEGGISHYSACLAGNLLRRGHSVYAFAATQFDPEPGTSRQDTDVEIIRIPGPWNHRTVDRIKIAAREIKLDAVILQYSPPAFKFSFRIRWALSRFSCPKITAFHSLWGSRIDQLLALLILSGSTRIVATNSEIMSILKKHLSFFLKKTEWIPIASPIPSNTRRVEPNKEAGPIISFFGMLYPGKGLYLILDVLKELKNSGHRFRFKFIGGWILYDKGYEAQFRQDVRARNLSGLVDILGMVSREDVSKWLNRSRFVFLPYDGGLSDRRSSLMTALAHGKAILTSPPIVAMPAFQNGVNMLWPEAPTVPNYIKLIEQMLADDALIGDLEKNAEKLAQNFSWPKIAEAYESAITEKAIIN